VNNENTVNISPQYWIVVDAVRLPDAMDALTSASLVVQAWPLFEQSDFEHLIEQSPWVVNIGQDKSQLTSCFTLPGFDSSAVAFELDERHSVEALRHHMHALLLPYIDNKPTFLRFYAPTFWRPISEQLNPKDVVTLLGPASAVFWMSNTGQLNHIQKPENDNTLPQRPYYLHSAILTSWV
jgi:hypothetical protein